MEPKAVSFCETNGQRIKQDGYIADCGPGLVPRSLSIILLSVLYIFHERGYRTGIPTTAVNSRARTRQFRVVLMTKLSRTKDDD